MSEYVSCKNAEEALKAAKNGKNIRVAGIFALTLVAVNDINIIVNNGCFLNLTLDSSQATIKTWDSSQATIKTWGNSQATIKTLGSSQATIKTLDSSQATIETWDSSQATIKTWGNSQATIKTLDSSQATIETWGSSQATIKTWGNSQATIKTWGNSQATIETLGSSQATIKTRDSSQATIETWDSSQATIETLGSSQATIKTWGNSQATIKTLDSSQATIETWDSSQATIVTWGNSQATIVTWDSSQATIEAVRLPVDTTHNFQCVDGYTMLIESHKQVDDFDIYKAKYVSSKPMAEWKSAFVAKKDGVTAHGDTIRSAIADVQFKLFDDDDIEELARRVKERGVVSFSEARLLSDRACEAGVKHFLDENGEKPDIDEMSLEKALKLCAASENPYAKAFVRAIKGISL